MIQFNLLPDVKLEYLKTRRTQHSVITTAIAVAGALLFILILLMMVVNVFQKKHLRDLNGDIKSYSNKLSEVKGLDKILTVQNQLGSLPALHDQKPVASRLFNFISQLTPAQASIANLGVDFDAHTVNLSGAANSLVTINKFTDTLKFTSFKTGSQSAENKAFSDVVLTSFNPIENGFSYQLNFNFDPTIFDSKDDVTLSVPNIITTRSSTEKPDALFQQTESNNPSQ